MARFLAGIVGGSVHKLDFCVAFAALVSIPQVSLAGPETVPVVDAAPATASAPSVEPLPVAAPARCSDCIPALTPVELVIDDHLGSKLSRTGATFPLHLGKPIVLAGREVVAAGATGEGEVIHAKKAGGMGAPGELVLAARFVTVDGRPLKLRSMRISLAGKDAIHVVDTINAASVISPLPVGIVGFFMTGSNLVVTRGTVAEAKTSADFPLSAIAPAGLQVPTTTAEPAHAGPANQGEKP